MSSPHSTPDPNLSVCWSSPFDPSNPINWPRSTKTTQILCISFMNLYANLAAITLAPAAPLLATEFHITNNTLTSLTVSIHILGFVFGPFFVPPLSEIYGRLWLYHACNVAYMGFTVGCALSTNTGMLLVCRFLCGCVASGPMAIGGGSIADLYETEERGKAIAMMNLGQLLGPVIGPVIGGFVAQRLGWRWIFWLVLVIAGIVTMTGILLLRETFEPVLLAHKAATLRSQTGNMQFQARTHDATRTPTQLVLRAITRPIRLLISSPIVLLLSMYCAFVYGLIYILFTTFPTVFESTYHFSTELAGLAYLGLGVGMLISVAIFVMLSNAKSDQSAPRIEHRLLLMVWSAPLVPIGFFWYGWSAEMKCHWLVPICGTVVIGFAVFLVLMPGQLYLVDAFGAEGAASALAVNTVFRCLFGALMPLAGPPLYSKLQLGWGNSVLAFVAMVFVPVPLLFYRYGERLRRKYPVRF